MSVDVLFCAVPYVETAEPIMAPAVLKGALKDTELTVAAIDLNIEVLNKIENLPHRPEILDFFLDQTVTANTHGNIMDLILYCTDRIREYSPKTLGLSLLTYSCQIFTKWLLVNLRAEFPDMKIVIGGTGIKAFIADPSNTFCETMREQGLIDDYIVGDGELVIKEYFAGNREYPGINNDRWEPIPDLNSLPWADYDDYDFTQYANAAIPMVDSRGCVRTCEFCDVIQYWKKYQYRSAESTFAEMMYQVKRHGINRISIRNSLTNGNMKEFGKLVKAMGDYNDTMTDQDKLSWMGFFIIRSAKHHTEELWHDISRSQGTLLLGVESVLEHIRYQMGKKFLDEDLDHHLVMGQKFSVPLVLLMIISYPTETRADYEYTKQWFRDRAQYANNSVTSLILSPASILPGTELEQKRQEYGVVSGKYPAIWINQNLNITTAEKIQYHEELSDLCEDLGFNVNRREHVLKTSLNHAEI